MSSSRAIDIAIKSAEQLQAKELDSKFSAKMKASVKDVGAPDTVRHTVLTYVATEGYDKAIEELKKHVESKTDFPHFKSRVERYTKYGIDLIHAIKAKRSFPGFQHLSVSKQQELFDRAMDHFDDLKVTLKKVEQIERELKLEDIRSTVLVVKALVYSLFAIAILGFLLEMSRGVLPTAWIVIDSTFGDISNFIFDKLGI